METIDEILEDLKGRIEAAREEAEAHPDDAWYHTMNAGLLNGFYERLVAAWEPYKRKGW